MDQRLDQKTKERLRKVRPECRLLDARIDSLSDYLAIFNERTLSGTTFWFRGHASLSWDLTPSALRVPTHKREQALSLVSEFKRIAQTKLPNPPSSEEDLKWVQTARHYGLPTRLLDWTLNAAVALYFATLPSVAKDASADGAVFLLNPDDLNREADPRRPRVFNAVEDSDIIKSHLLDALRNRKAKPLSIIAIEPVWDSERILLQRGVFTLHSDNTPTLNSDQAPSLLFVPILEKRKRLLRDELGRIGIDEMSIFPEPEHICSHLLHKHGLL